MLWMFLKGAIEMGYNTGLIVLNDALDQISKHPVEFVQKLSEAVAFNMRGDKPIDISAGNHANAATVFHQSHADNVGVYAIGGNCASRFVEIHNGGRHVSDEDKVLLLKAMANEMGFRLVKNRRE